MPRLLFAGALVLGAASLLLSGCHDSSSSTESALALPHTVRPLVAVVPLVDHAKHNLDWDLSEELTAAIHHQLSEKTGLYLVNLDKVKQQARKARSYPSPFGKDIQWMRKAFPHQEFVVFTELTDHSEITLPSRSLDHSVTKELHLAVRLRVIDLRTDVPRVALQEIVQIDHNMQGFLGEKEPIAPPTEEHFLTTPVGRAHGDLSREIADRIETYVLLGSDTR